MAENIGNLKNKTISSVLWKGFERIFAQLVSAIVTIILARILVPDDYSVVGIVAIFFAFCNIFISGGLNTALIQKKEADILDFSTILMVNLAMAAALYLAMFFCAPFIANLYDKPILIPIIRVMAVTFFINGYKAVVSAKIASDLQFRKFFWSTFIGTVISAVVGITMALKGFGPWALVAQQMINAFIDAVILTITSRFRFLWRFSASRFRDLFRYGGKIFAASIITVTYDQIKPLIVGIKYTATDLAYYNKGKTYPELISSTGNDTLSSALFPAMAKIQDDPEKILAATRKFTQLSSFLLFPLMIGFLTVSENFVRIVLTEKWLPIVPYLMIFCISEMLKPIQTGNTQAIKAIGRSGVILALEITKKSAYAVIILLFVLFTHSPVLLAVSGIATSVFAAVVNFFLNKKIINYKYRHQFADLADNFFSAVTMGAVVYFMRYIPINYYLLTVLQLLTGIVIYAGISLLIRNKNLFYLLNNIKSFSGSRNGRTL